MLDERVRTTLPTTWPSREGVRSASVDAHLRANWQHLEHLPRDVALWLLVEHATEALGEDAREPYGGMVTIDGDVLRVRFGQLPRSQPDAHYSAPELEPIPIHAVLREI